MNDLINPTPALVAPDAQTLQQLRAIESVLREVPQIAIPVSHLFHGGMYARTVQIPEGLVAMGVQLKRASVLILVGDATVFTGTDSVRLTGCHVIPGSAGRKQLFRTHAPTHLVMLFPSHANSPAEAEAEFTNETDLLMPVTDRDSVIHTGE